jgi:hypothetical protein
MEISIRIATTMDTANILNVIENSYIPFKDSIPNNCNFNITLNELNDLIVNTHGRVWLAMTCPQISPNLKGGFHC